MQHPVSRFAKVAFVALTALSLLTASVYAAATNDMAKLQKGGVVVKEKPSASKSADALPVVSAQIIIPRSSEDVWEFVSQHPERLMDKEKSVKSLKVVSQSGNSKDLAYTVNMSKLLPTFQYTLRHQPTAATTLSFWRTSGSFKDVRGSWYVQSLDGGKRSILTYNLSMDPGPLVPRFLMANILKADLPDMMNNVKSVIVASK